MHLIELHIIQSFPVSCLNRDDLGSPKSAVFGGVKRARISSQCLKRAQRELFREYAPGYAKGMRTKLIASALLQCLKEESEPLPEPAEEIARKLAEIWGKLDDKKGSDGLPKSTTLTYISPEEAEATVAAALPLFRGTGAPKPDDLKKAVKTAMKKTPRKSAADIALFGRMVANDPSLNVEGAALFSHAISCHKTEPEMDYYTAVDDLQSNEESGAGMTGVLEFNSACYYRYIGINVDLLRENLSVCTDEEIHTILGAFIRSALMAVPSARKNSMNAATLPSYVLGVRRTGQPLQLANAFEEPVRSQPNHGGYITGSIEALKEELRRMKDTWGYQDEVEVAIPDIGLAGFVSRLTEPNNRE